MVAVGGSVGTPVALVAGGIAGGVEAAATYPFEFAKTRVQLRDGPSAKPQTNPFVVVRDIARQQGLRALYVGCGVLVVGSVGKDAVRFLAFDSIKGRFANPQTGTLSTSGNLLAGVACGVIASTVVVTPSERIKTAMIDDARRGTPRFRSTTQAVLTIVREQGLTGLYRGYVGTTLKQTGATGFRLGSYHIMKDAMKARKIRGGPHLDFGIGAVAGFVTTVATQPADVVKTRSQNVGGTSTMRAVREIYADLGIRGFWKGTTMRLGRTVFSGGILFTVYEQVVKILQPQIPVNL